MLPRETYERLVHEGHILGLKMLLGSEKRVLYFLIETVETPIDLMAFSLGAAVRVQTAGTGWSEITDSQGRYHLEPEHEKVLYHGFFGVSPGQAWVYLRYPTNVDIHSLIGTRTIGSGVGHIDGKKSPYSSPSPITEFFTLKGQHPSFLGYNPYDEPNSITVRLAFYLTRYDVKFLGVDPSGVAEIDDKRVIASAEDRGKAKVRPVGGHSLADVPSWVETAMRRG